MLEDAHWTASCRSDSVAWPSTLENATATSSLQTGRSASVYPTHPLGESRGRTGPTPACATSSSIRHECRRKPNEPGPANGSDPCWRWFRQVDAVTSMTAIITRSTSPSSDSDMRCPHTRRSATPPRTFTGRTDPLVAEARCYRRAAEREGSFDLIGDWHNDTGAGEQGG